MRLLGLCLVASLVASACADGFPRGPARRLLASLSPSTTTAASTSSSNATFCVCDEDYVPICGLDGQTYGNECVLECVSGIFASSGHCNPVCYPSGNSVSTGDWSSRQPVCLNGVTWRNLAEAEYNGGPDECAYDGVCLYNTRDGENVSYWPTTGGNGASVLEAAQNQVYPSKAAADAPYDYSEALAKALIYYDSHISGVIEPDAQRLAWRGDSCTNCTGSYNEDLSKGYYESGGSTMKLGVVINFATSVLAWAGIDFQAGFEQTGRLSELKYKVKHGADYLLSSLVSTDPIIFMGSYGNSTRDFDNYSPPEYFDRYVLPRPAGYLTEDDPGSEVAAGAAAALAASALLLHEDNAEWAQGALAAAETLYTLATANPKSFADSADPTIQDMQYLYRSDGNYEDEIAWAAAWLARASNALKDPASSDYYDYAPDAASWLASSQQHNTFEVWQYQAGAAVLLCKIAPNDDCKSRAKTFFDGYLTQSSITHTDAGAAVPYHWTGLQHAGHAAMLGVLHAQGGAVDDAYGAQLVNYARFQTDYVLGAAGRSWMVGFGSDYPTYTWHKPSFFSTLTWTDDMGELVWMGRDIGPWSTKVTDLNKYVQRAKFKMEGSQEPNVHTAYGLIFAAPLLNDGLIASRRDYSYAESTVVSNTGFVGAFAAFAEWYDLGPYAGLSSLDEVYDLDYDTLLASSFA